MPLDLMRRYFALMPFRPSEKVSKFKKVLGCFSRMFDLHNSLNGRKIFAGPSPRAAKGFLYVKKSSVGSNTIPPLSRSINGNLECNQIAAARL
jgi:hypothetical protein